MGRTRFASGTLHSWREVAFLASAGAAAIHFAAAAPHMMEYRPAAAFMIVSGAAQAVWALALLRAPSASLYRAGIAGNASIILLWIVSRTVGLPVGPQPWIPEHVHAPDAVATTLEFVIVAAGFMLLARDDRGGLVLAAIAAAGVAASAVVSAHDPAREHVTAVATLLIIGSARALMTVAPHLVTSTWRRHETIALARRSSARVLSPARAGIGAGG